MSDKPLGTSPTEVRSVRSEEFEDVLALRVVKKVMAILALFAAVVGGTLIYAGIHLEKVVAAAEASIKTREEAVTKLTNDLTEQLHKTVAMYEVAKVYQNALANQLRESGALQSQVEATRTTADQSNHETTRSLVALEKLRDEQVRRYVADSARLSAFEKALNQRIEGLTVDLYQRVGSAEEQLHSISERAQNTWVVVVAEDQKTPIGTSGVWVIFDDVKADSSLSKFEIHSRSGERRRFSFVRKNEDLSFEFGMYKYHAVVIETAREGLLIDTHGRATIRLERWPNGGAASTKASPVKH